MMMRKGKRETKTRVTVTIPSSLLDRTKNAVYWSKGQTLAGMIVDSLERNLGRLLRQRGREFPARRGQLRAGRPPKDKKPSTIGLSRRSRAKHRPRRKR